MFNNATLIMSMTDAVYVASSVTHLTSMQHDLGMSDDTTEALVSLGEEVIEIWDNDEWAEYGENGSYEGDHRYWTLAIVDADTVILALQTLAEQASMDAEDGNTDAASASRVLFTNLIPRFTNLFTRDEWGKYEAEIATAI
jgi:hypothetical protein